MQESYLIMTKNFHSLLPAQVNNPFESLFMKQNSPFISDPYSMFGQLGSANEALYSHDTNTIVNRVTALRNPISPASIALTHDNKSINEQLFDATSGVKILTSQVAMNLDSAFREKLFAQIDYLHDHDDWDPEDKPVQNASFTTFLRTILYIKPKRYPGLGLSYAGNVIAAWTTGKDRLTIEFLPDDQVKWVLSKNYSNGEVERSASQSSVLRILECLAPYHPENWLF